MKVIMVQDGTVEVALDMFASTIYDPRKAVRK